MNNEEQPKFGDPGPWLGLSDKQTDAIDRAFAEGFIKQVNAEQRAPLLSDDVILTLTQDDQPHAVAYAVRYFYEAKITSGELRVVKTARMERMQVESWLDPYYKCSACGHEWTDYFPDVNEFCKCGAKIIE